MLRGATIETMPMLSLFISQIAGRYAHGLWSSAHMDEPFQQRVFLFLSRLTCLSRRLCCVDGECLRASTFSLHHVVRPRKMKDEYPSIRLLRALCLCSAKWGQDEGSGVCSAQEAGTRLNPKIKGGESA